MNSDEKIEHSGVTISTVIPPLLSILGLIATLSAQRPSLTAALCFGPIGIVFILNLIHRGLPKVIGDRFDALNLIFFVVLAGGLSTSTPQTGLLCLTVLVLSVPIVFQWSQRRLGIFYAASFCVYFGFHHPQWDEFLDPSLATPALIFTFSGVMGFLFNKGRLDAEHASRSSRDELHQATKLERGKLTELKDLDRLKTGFYSSIVEGLRGPLTLMLSPLDSMLSGDVGNFQANQIEYLETIRRNALRVLRLSDDLVDLSHLESGLLRIQTENSSMVGMLQSVVDHANPAAQSKGIQLSFTAEGGEISIAIDVEKLERAITHLVSTALRYTRHGGRIDIQLLPKDNGAQLVIRDNGSGLPPDWIEALSESDGHKKWLPPRSPEGVGLVLAREIVHLHKGLFTTDSQPDIGTTFTITLPKGEPTGPNTRPGEDARSIRLRQSDNYRFGAVQDSALPSPVDHAPSESKATKVLVVDDNPEILQFTKSLLSKEHAVFVAANGSDGLALAKAELPDVVITDTRMPKLDGNGLIEAMREDPRLAHVPTIILTARNQVTDREAARLSGADLVMDKPFNPRELRTAIQELFAKQHRQASNFMNEQARSFEIISAGLAHEMHNPLAYIKNANFVIAESARKAMTAAQNPNLSDDERQRAFDKAKEKIDKMLPVSDRGIKKVEQLVALMRRYAREGYSSDAVDMKIDQSIADVLAMIAPKDNKEVSIESDLAAPEAVIKGVPEELQQAITNLTQNAVDAVDKDGHVWVRTRPEARTVRIEVADDGPGIPRDALARIFTPFFTTKEVGKGMGLGLTITRQVIKQHGGTLEVDSTPGQGTTFTIRLPLASENTSQDEESALEQAAQADVLSSPDDEPTDPGTPDTEDPQPSV